MKPERQEQDHPDATVSSDAAMAYPRDPDSGAGLDPAQIYRHAQEHQASMEVPYDVQSGLSQLKEWMAHDTDSTPTATAKRKAKDPRPHAGAAAATTDVALLVRRAAEGDRQAWERLVDQYARLIWSITVEFKLAESDGADVAQTTWLRLLEHIDRIEHPERVGSWLAATARHECLRILAARKKVVLAHDEEEVLFGPQADQRILADDRDQAVRDALSRLPRRWQRLLELLMADPPASYAEISGELGLPLGSIGPSRRRCLARLREQLQTSEADADSQVVPYTPDDSESYRDWTVVGNLVRAQCG
jgi:RNA polymerase sigma factor (sigma-70 family)